MPKKAAATSMHTQAAAKAMPKKAAAKSMHKQAAANELSPVPAAAPHSASLSLSAARAPPLTITYHDRFLGKAVRMPVLHHLQIAAPLMLITSHCTLRAAVRQPAPRHPSVACYSSFGQRSARASCSGLRSRRVTERRPCLQPRAPTSSRMREQTQGNVSTM